MTEEVLLTSFINRQFQSEWVGRDLHYGVSAETTLQVSFKSSHLGSHP
jgi:hypothetical protein